MDALRPPWKDMQPSASFAVTMVPTVRELENVLWRHVLELWFPRCLDRDEGGFLCDFDMAWNRTGPDDRLIEFQARQTLTAAEAAMRYPAAAHLREAALHGYRYIAEVMWDREYGGWFHRTDRAGVPQEGATKHTHGFGYAIVACLAVHRLTGERGPLDLARTAADWLDRHAYDPTEGGYFGMMDRAGAVIRGRDPKTWDSPADSLGLPFGTKDANVHTDMLETLASLAAVPGGRGAAERLAELIGLFTERLVQPSGALPYVFSADWRPLPPPERTGYLLQGVHRLLGLSRAGIAPASAGQAAHRMISHALAALWDPRRGGFYEMGSPDGRASDGDAPPGAKTWWVQWEGLRALADFHDDGARPDYARYCRALWRYIERYILDRRHGGTFWYGLDGFGPWQRLTRANGFAPDRPAKGEIWKDASHEARALMHCLRRLERPTAEEGRAAARTTAGRGAGTSTGEKERR